MSEEEKFKLLLSRLDEHFQEEKSSTRKREFLEALEKFIKTRQEKKFKDLLLEAEKKFQEQKNSHSRNNMIHKLGEFVKSIQVETPQVNNFVFCH